MIIARLYLLSYLLLLAQLVDSDRVFQKSQFVGWARLGAGAYSTVYRARDTLNGNLVVSIKDVNAAQGIAVGTFYAYHQSHQLCVISGNKREQVSPRRGDQDSHCDECHQFHTSGSLLRTFRPGPSYLPSDGILPLRHAVRLFVEEWADELRGCSECGVPARLCDSASTRAKICTRRLARWKHYDQRTGWASAGQYMRGMRLE